MTTFYVANRHFTYSGIKCEPGLVFPKLAVRNNHLIESKGMVEIYLGKEDDLVSCPECPGKFLNSSYRDSHMRLNIHVGGKVIMSQEGIRTKEQEEEMDALQKSVPKARPGKVRVDSQGDEVTSRR